MSRDWRPPPLRRAPPPPLRTRRPANPGEYATSVSGTPLAIRRGVNCPNAAPAARFPVPQRLYSPACLPEAPDPPGERDVPAPLEGTLVERCGISQSHPWQREAIDALMRAHTAEGGG